jgi:hypothetical protein
MLTENHVKKINNMISDLMEIRYQNDNEKTAAIFNDITDAITHLLRASDFPNRDYGTPTKRG